MEDRRIKVHKIAEVVGISVNAVHNILHKKKKQELKTEFLYIFLPYLLNYPRPSTLGPVWGLESTNHYSSQKNKMDRNFMGTLII